MSTYPCCEHCAEDNIHDVPKDGHEIPCNTLGPCSTRPHENTVWTENAALRATVERVKDVIRAERFDLDARPGGKAWDRAYTQGRRDMTAIFRAAIEGKP